MIRYRCDNCGKDLGAGSGDHFVVRIEAFAATEPLEITTEDLAKDHQAEIRRLVNELSRTPLDDTAKSRSGTLAHTPESGFQTNAWSVPAPESVCPESASTQT